MHTRSRLALFVLVLSAAVAQAQINYVTPRGGWVDGYWPTGSLVVVADTDEGLLVSELTDFEFFVDVVSEMHGGGLEPPGTAVTEAPHQLDAGDYALAFGLLTPNALSPIGYDLGSFFQLRLAGSSATALTGVAGTPDPGTDPQVPLDLIDDRIVNTYGGLAAMAVAQDQWSSVDDYIEFPPEHALLYPSGPASLGPAGWQTSVLPEPGTAALVCLALTAVGRTTRRRAAE